MSIINYEIFKKSEISDGNLERLGTSAPIPGGGSWFWASRGIWGSFFEEKHLFDGVYDVAKENYGNADEKDKNA